MPEDKDVSEIRALAREFANREIAPVAAAIDRQGEFPAATAARMGELGLFGLALPWEYGGAGKGLTHLAAAIEEVSRACASHGITLSTHATLCAGAIERFGNAEQKQRFLPALAAGRFLGAFCLTEKEAGTDAGNIQSIATPCDEGYLLNGRKIFITNGAVAQVFIVFAKTDPGAGRKGISAFIVERGTPGFSVGKKFEKMGIRASCTNELVFDNCLVPASNLLGGSGEGFRIAMRALDDGRIGVAAQALGIAGAALDLAVTHVAGRIQFGKPLSSNQGIQWMLADMAVKVKASSMLTAEAARLRDQGLPYSSAAAMAKLHASETAMEICTRAVQLHGGIGYTSESTVERLMRDAKITEIYEGTSEVQRMIIAADLLEKHGKCN
ncbi:acyl-CoA dehydrogenase family protein [Desulfovibrio sp. OttesenSCG-928-C06]|nr:acyl-CoA dehydrogenase family protein [Desulfovibrio sp. OttesenSCG-928-C06]